MIAIRLMLFALTMSGRRAGSHYNVNLGTDFVWADKQTVESSTPSGFFVYFVFVYIEGTQRWNIATKARTWPGKEMVSVIYSSLPHFVTNWIVKDEWVVCECIWTAHIRYMRNVPFAHIMGHIVASPATINKIVKHYFFWKTFLST